MKSLKQLVETVKRTREGRASALFLAMAMIGLSPMALLGAPLDSVFGYAGIALLVGGLIFLVWGIFTFMTVKGKAKIMGGVAGLVVAIIIVAIFGVPALPSGGFVNPPGTPGTWSVCLTNGNFATVGLGTCPQSLVGAKSVLKSQTAPTSNYRVYFNITIVAPAGSTQTAFNVIVQATTPPSLSNTSNPSQTGPVLALLTGGQYDVVITPASGTATNQLQIIPITPGTSKVVAFQVHFSTMIGLLSLGQYPVGVTTTYTVSDQLTGVVYATISLSTTFT